MTSDASLEVSERIRRAAECHLAAKGAEAEALLQGIDEESLQRSRVARLGRITRGGKSVPTIPKSMQDKRYLPPSGQLATFFRDRFTCRYCGTRTIFAPTMRILSMQYPDVFPYHPNGAFGKGHLIYWTHQSCCEHVVPVARGGTSNPDNVVTACWLCNQAKRNALIEELGWDLMPPTERDWDGLSTVYLRLWNASPDAQSNGELAKWRKALLARPAHPKH